MTSAALVRANSIAIPLRDNSVDLIVTSPPYFALRSYQDGGEHYDGQIGSEATPSAFLAALWAVTDECWRVLRPRGSLFVNLGDKFAGSGGHNNSNLANLHGNYRDLNARDVQANKVHARGQAARRNAPDRYNQAAAVRSKSRMLLPHRYALGCVDPDYRAFVERHDRTGPQWVCRMDMVWSKPNGLPESVTDRVRASHEYWFHLTKSEQYYANVDQVREGYAPGTTERYKAGFKSNSRADSGLQNQGVNRSMAAGELLDGLEQNPLGKLPGSVWSIPTEPLTVPDWLGVDHYAAFPTEWPRRLTLGWSPPDGVVLDPFGGTGTTAMVARALGRYGVNIDLSADYLRLARWRIFESGHWDKAVERTTGRRCDTPTQLPGQLDLFNERTTP